MAEQLSLQIDVNGSQAVKSLGEIRKEIKQSTADLLAAQQKFGDYSAEALSAAKKVAKLKDSIQEATETASLFDPGKKFQVFAGSLSAIAGGFTAVQGAVGLLGVESKEVEKSILKVQSALALSQGLSTIADSAKDFQRLGAVIKDTALKAFGSLKAAIISTGIGALVIGLGLLIANFDAVKKAVLNLVPGLGKVADFIGKLVNKVTDFVGITSEAGRATAKLIKDNDKAIKESERFLELNGDKYDEYTQRKIKANDEFRKKQNEFLKDETLSEEQKNEFIKQARDKADREILRSTKDRNDKQIEINKKSYEDQKKRQEEANKLAVENSKKKTDEQKRLDQEEQQRIKEKNDREIAAQKLQIDAFRATLSEREQATLQAEDELEEKKATLIKAGNFNFELLEEEHRLKLAGINDKYNKEDLDKKKAVDDINLQRERELAELNAVTLEDRKSLELQNLETEYNDKLLLAITNGENIVALEELFAAKKLDINQKFIEEKKQQDAQILEGERQLADAKFAIASAGITLLGSLVGENEKIANALFVVDKALAITKVIFDSIAEISSHSAYGAALGPAGLAYAPPRIVATKLRAGASIATIAATTIAKFKGGAASANFGSGGSISTSGVPIIPQQGATITQLNQASINALGNQAVRAYVVETDVTSSQQRIAAIQQRARFS